MPPPPASSRLVVAACGAPSISPDADGGQAAGRRRQCRSRSPVHDGSYLALTWRQIQTIVKASRQPLRSNPASDSTKPGANPLHPGPLTPRNLSAQLHYAAAGNPVSSRPVTSVSNCTPGLEFDLRAVWRRIFVGIEFREWDNLVIRMDPDAKVPKLRDFFLRHGHTGIREVHILGQFLEGNKRSEPLLLGDVFKRAGNHGGINGAANQCCKAR